MKPAEELRAAAAKLREMAAAATPGPWFNHDAWLPQGGYTATVLSGEPGNGELRAWCPTWSNEPWDQKRNSWNDAAWMAFMGPDKAEPLAAWLSVTEDCMPYGFVHSVEQEAALTFARSILGESR